MHSFTTKNGTRFHHNGDYSGDVIIDARGFSDITLPCVDLLEFTANYVRQKRISQLENASLEEILNVLQRR